VNSSVESYPIVDSTRVRAFLCSGFDVLISPEQEPVLFFDGRKRRRQTCSFVLKRDKGPLGVYRLARKQ
jgi:hypothetical protein